MSRLVKAWSQRPNGAAPTPVASSSASALAKAAQQPKGSILRQFKLLVKRSWFQVTAEGVLSQPNPLFDFVLSCLFIRQKIGTDSLIAATKTWMHAPLYTLLFLTLVHFSLSNAFCSSQIASSARFGQVTRDKATTVSRVMANLSSALVFGAIFFRMSRQQSSVQDRLGLLQVGGGWHPRAGVGVVGWGTATFMGQAGCGWGDPRRDVVWCGVVMAAAV